MTARKSIQASVQAKAKRSMKTSTARLQDRSLQSATRTGLAWDDEEVARLVQGIEADEPTYEMAIAIGRSYYGTMGARAHVAFAMRHSQAIWGTRKKK